jgi:hypothetical protein
MEMFEKVWVKPDGSTEVQGLHNSTKTPPFDPKNAGP